MLTNLRQGNIFISVCHSVHGGSATPPLGRHPLWADTLRADIPQADTPMQTPPGQTPPRQTPPRQTPIPPGQTPFLGRHPPGETPPPQLWVDTLPQVDTPLPSACWDTPPCPVHAGIRSTRRRYASYWNAFLFFFL